MNRPSWIAAAFLMLVLGHAGSLAGEGDVGADDTAEVEAIKRTVHMKTEGVVKLDPEIYAGAFAEDAVVLPPGGAALEGRAAILQWARGWAAAADVEVEAGTTIDEVQVIGDWAFVRATIARTIRSPDRDPRSDIVKTIQVQRRQDDGSWKIARDIWNSHRPPEEAAAE